MARSSRRWRSAQGRAQQTGLGAHGCLRGRRALLCGKRSPCHPPLPGNTPWCCPRAGLCPALPALRTAAEERLSEGSAGRSLGPSLCQDKPVACRCSHSEPPPQGTYPGLSLCTVVRGRRRAASSADDVALRGGFQSQPCSSFHARFQRGRQ